jgi:CII-binding regulator of phage lambda lysogenization HflD
MAPDDAGWIEWAFKSLVAFVVAMLAYFGQDMKKDIEGVKSEVRVLHDAQDQSALALAKYMLDVERTFAKDASVQSSLGRIHDRLDEMSNDIKTLIGAVGQRHGVGH